MPKTCYIWDGDNIAEEVDENGNTIVEYTYKSAQYGELISQRRWDGAAWQTRVHHYDALGSTIALTDETGAVTDTYEYDAWGNPISVTGSTENPFRWVGKLGYYWDEDLGTYYIRRRTYQPLNARWLSEDPAILIGLIREVVNRYEYCELRPTSIIDASGLYPSPICICPCPLTPFPLPWWPPIPPWLQPKPRAPLTPHAPHLCGPDVTAELTRIAQLVPQLINALPPARKQHVCSHAWSPGGWDIVQLAGWCVGPGIPSAQCQRTVTVNGSCHYGYDVNYFLWGLGNSACGNSALLTFAAIHAWKAWRYFSTGNRAEYWARRGFGWPRLPMALVTPFTGCQPATVPPTRALTGHFGGMPF